MESEVTVNARPVREYREALDAAEEPRKSPKNVSLTDPAAQWTAAPGGSAFYAYSTNLIDAKAGVIVDVEACPVFLSSPGPKGQAAVRYGLVAQAVDKAVDESREAFSPAKFAQTLERLREPKDVFFRGQAKRELDSFAKLMRHVERAGQYAENPPTGQRVISWLLGGAAALNAPLAAQLAAMSGSARALLTTQAGQRLLLAASRLKDGSPALAKLLQRIERTLPKVAGATAAHAAASGPERSTSAPRVAGE